MRRLVISTAAVFCACVALCVWSVVKLNGILDEAHEMTVTLIAYVGLALVATLVGGVVMMVKVS